MGVAPAADAGGTDSGSSFDEGRTAPAPEQDCGAAEIVDGTALRRHPYLQSTTQTSVIVAWTTTSGGRGTVRYAPGPGGPWTEVEAGAELFEVSRTGDDEDYTAHSAQLSGLLPDQDYCYEVQLDGTVLARGLRLHTAWERARRVAGQPLRILALGDSGTGDSDQAAVRDEMLMHPADIFLGLGDIAYSDGEFREFEQNMFAVYQDMFHAVPQFPAIGNHEYHTDNGQPYVDVFYLFEQALRPEHQERYYSFDYGDVHFVSLDSNSEMMDTISDSADDDMIDWLRDDLLRSDATWKVAFMHHPAYSSGSHGSTSRVQDDIVPVLEEGGVDIALAGHDHHYERMVPLLSGAEAADDLSAITYVVAGGGGAGLRSAGGDWFTATVNDSIHNFLLFTIDGCQGRGQAIDVNGDVIDSFEVNGCD